MLKPGPPLTTCSPPIPPTTRLSHPGDGSVPSYDTNKPTTVFPSFLDPVHLDRVAVAHSLPCSNSEKKNPVPRTPITHPPPSTQHFRLRVGVPYLLPPPSPPHLCLSPSFNLVAHLFFKFIYPFVPFLFSE